MSLLGGFATALTAAPLPPNVIEAPDASPQVQQQIRQFVDENLKLMGSEKLADVAAAREAMVAPLRSSSSPAFLEAYSLILNDTLVRSIDGLDIPRRLNAAIVVARVAEASRNTQTVSLRPIVERLLKDKALAVQLWGIKAAGSVLPRVLNNPTQNGADSLVRQIIAIVQANARDAAIVNEAYDTFIEPLVGGGGRTNAAPELYRAAGPTLAKAVQDILRIRTELYGSEVPKEPSIEATAVFFLTYSRLVDVLPQQARGTSVALLANLLEQAKTAMASAGGNTGADAGLRGLIKQIGSGFAAFSRATGRTALADESERVYQISASTPTEEVIRRSDELLTAVREAFPELPTTQPAN